MLPPAVKSVRGSRAGFSRRMIVGLRAQIAAALEQPPDRHFESRMDLIRL
jgi:hypothetical protein